MPSQPNVVRADCLDAEYNHTEDTVTVLLVLENGDHLHIVLTRRGFRNLSQYIEYVQTQLPAPSDRQ